MHTAAIPGPHREQPSLFWRGVLYVVAIGRVAIGGAGLALAAIGLANLVTLAIGAHWLDWIDEDSDVQLFAVIGAVGACVAAAIYWLVVAHRGYRQR